MRIEIDSKLCITSDSNQLMVCEKGINKKKDSDNYGEETLKTLGYFKDLSQCGKFLVDHKVMTSGATSFKELVAEVRAFRDEVVKALEI